MDDLKRQCSIRADTFLLGNLHQFRRNRCSGHPCAASASNKVFLDDCLPTQGSLTDRCSSTCRGGVIHGVLPVQNQIKHLANCPFAGCFALVSRGMRQDSEQHTVQRFL